MLLSFTQCMVRYVTMEVTEGAYEISCPDSECEKQEGRLQMSEIEILRFLIENHGLNLLPLLKENVEK